jgi:hypothetical protein
MESATTVPDHAPEDQGRDAPCEINGFEMMGW